MIMCFTSSQQGAGDIFLVSFYCQLNDKYIISEEKVSAEGLTSSDQPRPCLWIIACRLMWEGLAYYGWVHPWADVQKAG